VTVAEKTGPVTSFQRPRTIAELTEYHWQQDSTRDPFVRFLNKGDVSEVLRRMRRG
jgi:hypothetical protein